MRKLVMQRVSSKFQILVNILVENIWMVVENRDKALGKAEVLVDHINNLRKKLKSGHCDGYSMSKCFGKDFQVSQITGSSKLETEQYEWRKLLMKNEFSVFWSHSSGGTIEYP